MVKYNQLFHYHADGSLNIEQWLIDTKSRYQLTDVALLTQTIAFADKQSKGLTTIYGKPCLMQGLEIADILLALRLDQECAAAGILYAALLLSHPSDDLLRKELGDSICKLITGLRQIELITSLQKQKSGNLPQIDKIRKMLLSMATDIRVVMIKLAERLSFMRGIKSIPPDDRRRYAKEMTEIYAPLANRLGIGQIKWELEDLAFRYQEPIAYKEIATFLAERRDDRESHIQSLINQLKTKLKEGNIHAEVTGRAKHIYSIYNKMQRKTLDQHGIYDHTALRVLVPTVEACYTALGIVNSLFSPIEKEFDDYIANPKPNGYQSIHTAVVDAKGKRFEIQIRTYHMHEEAERGVAAHWQYKENTAASASDSEKINYLRQLLDWHKEMAKDNQQQALTTQQFENIVYVVTPAGDIIDLEKGATPIDFAYHVHTSVGNRCRGAKVNGHIVPLTYALKTGDKVEIHTVPDGGPSRDWLNVEAGYVKTSRARGKISHWFKQQLLEETAADTHDAAERKVTHPEQKKLPLPTLPKTNYKMQGSAITGASGLLTRFAKCCKPIPGDELVGYITKMGGISVHTTRCPNVKNLTKVERYLPIDWNAQKSSSFITDLKIVTEDHAKILNELTTFFVNEKIKLITFNSNIKRHHDKIIILTTIEVSSMNQLKDIKHRIKHIRGVIDVVQTR